MKHYVIVGAGNFGAATSLSLKSADPACIVTLIDSTPYPNPRAASHDINKIVRDDYPEAPYMSIMLKAMKLWNEDPLYSPYFNKTGYLRVDTGDFSDRVIKTYQALGVDNEAQWLTVEEVRKRFPPIATANFDGVSKVFWLPHAGWADAKGALTAVTDAAIKAGVDYCCGQVERLLITEDGHCSGVELQNGDCINADSVLLAAGANTGVILASTFPERKEMQAGTRLTAAGAVSFKAQLHGHQKEKFRNVPVIKSCLTHTDGEAMSMTASGVLKFNMAKSFTNLQNHELTGQRMSIPDRDNPARFTWTKPENFPKTLQERCYKVLHGLYGDEVRNLKIEAFRICWDAETPFHDFTISAHPAVPGLHLATGGSFHGWKFLPVIGDYIAAMLRGTLDPLYAGLWGWNAQIGTQAEADRAQLLGEVGTKAMSGHGYGTVLEDLNGEYENDSSSDSSSGASFRASSDEEELCAAPTPTKHSKASMANPTYMTDIDLADLLMQDPLGRA